MLVSHLSQDELVAFLVIFVTNQRLVCNFKIFKHVSLLRQIQFVGHRRYFCINQ